MKAYEIGFMVPVECGGAREATIEIWAETLHDAIKMAEAEMKSRFKWAEFWEVIEEIDGEDFR